MDIHSKKDFHLNRLMKMEEFVEHYVGYRDDDIDWTDVM